MTVLSLPLLPPPPGHEPGGCGSWALSPYIAPGLSSAAVSILQLLRGQVHFGAVPLGKAYFGCQSRMTPLGPRILQEELAPPLQQRIAEAFRELEEFSYD